MKQFGQRTSGMGHLWAEAAGAQPQAPTGKGRALGLGLAWHHGLNAH